MVRAWQETVVLPTYEVGAAEKNPMFLEKRVYQGSSGVVYPYPVIEKICDEKVDKSYNAVFIENQYIKVMILPELGGRIQMAYDKIKNRHFIYYNQVVKPALVGLTGPWISGGIEFNWPQHHRPSTFTPVDFTIVNNEDGSATVWVNEQERMFHQKGAAGFTLRPGKAVIEIEGRVQNPTPVPQTFLWWANPAVGVNDDYQSVFPPDVNAVFDHGKRDVSTFPIATGTYYKVDYSEGVDISNYKNIPVPTSYMAIASEYNFVGGYENDTQGGLLHVANHHVSPGKKQWTWGHGDFGQAWDRNLTDQDGPYIELMTGMFTDNQPDFTWLQPYETKTFTQYFMPYRDLGLIKNASEDILMSWNGRQFQVLATMKMCGVRIEILNKGEVVMSWTVDLCPTEVFSRDLPNDGDQDSAVFIYNDKGDVILSWVGAQDVDRPVPDAAKPALLPEEIDSCEQLFLTGLHLEQYRHATYNPEDYYREAIKRDSSDIRNNNALGLLLMRRGQFERAEKYFKKAIQTQLQRNPNPYDGEPHYNFGLCLKFKGENEAAYKALYKSCWNSAWQDAAYYALAQISSINRRWSEALSEVNKSLSRNWYNDRARALKAAILNRMGKVEQAKTIIDESIEYDKFNFGCRLISYMIGDQNREEMLEIMRADDHNYREIALDMMGAGLWDEALVVLTLSAAPSPMNYYYQAYATFKQGGDPASLLLKANSASAYCCFPNRLEDVNILYWAMQQNPADGKAPYYLGNLLYDKRQYAEAIVLWERSVAIDGSFPTAWRNLSLAYYNKQGDASRAYDALVRAFELDKTDARILMELDQLRKRLLVSHKERFDELSKYTAVVTSRDDLYLEFITLHNNLSMFEKALEMVSTRQFHPWEGGEGKVPAQYQFALLSLAQKAIKEGQFGCAIELLEKCYYYPHNFGEGKLTGAQENDFNYFMGLAYKGLGDVEKAKQYFKQAAIGLSEPAPAIYYNDQKPDKILYQGLALVELGEYEQAQKRFDRLIEYGNEHLGEHVTLDYFAVSLPDLLIWEDSLDRQSDIHCNYIIGLGLMGKGEHEKAKQKLSDVLTSDLNHQGAIIHRNQL